MGRGPIRGSEKENNVNNTTTTKLIKEIGGKA
jgi:hypothetical protein